MMVFDIFDVAGITFQLSRLPNVVLPTAASTVIFGAMKVSRHHKSLFSILLVRSTPPPPQPWDTCIKCLQWSTYLYVTALCNIVKITSVVQKYNSQRVTQSLVINLQCTYVPKG